MFRQILLSLGLISIFSIDASAVVIKYEWHDWGGRRVFCKAFYNDYPIPGQSLLIRLEVASAAPATPAPVSHSAPAPISVGDGSVLASRLEQDRRESLEQKLLRETRQTTEQISCMESAIADRGEKEKEAFEEKHKSRIEEIAEKIAAKKAQLALAALTLAEVAAPVAAAPFVGPALFVASAAVVAAVAVDVIQTPWGPAHQSDDPASKELRDKILEGDPVLHKIGKRGASQTGRESQFWSPAHPLTEEDYGKKYGVPQPHVDGADFLEKGKMKPDGKFVTRPAAPYRDQPGGAPEVVVEPGSVDVQSHSAL